MKFTALTVLLSALATTQAGTRKAGTHCDDFSPGIMTCSPDHRRLLACGAGPCNDQDDNDNHFCWGTLTDCGQQAARCFQHGDIDETPPFCQQYGNGYGNGNNNLGYGNNGYGNIGYGNNGYGNNVYGNDVYGYDQYGGNGYGYDGYGNNIYGNTGYGNGYYGNDGYGYDQYGNNGYGYGGYDNGNYYSGGYGY